MEENYVFKARKWWKSEWDLYHHDQIVGSIVLRSGWSGYSAEVHMKESDKYWQLKTKGWKNNLIILYPDGPVIVETTSKGFWKQVLDIELLEHRYTITSNWKGRQSASEVNGPEVAAVSPHWWKSAATAMIHNPKSEAHLLLTFLLFFRMKVEERTSSTTAAFVAISATN